MGHPVKSGKQYLQVPPAHYINPGAKDCMEGGVVVGGGWGGGIYLDIAEDY